MERVGQDNGRLPGPAGTCPSRTTRARNEWTRSDSQQQKIHNARCAIKAISFSFLLLPCASLSGSFLKRTTRFRMSPHTATWPQRGATMGADEGPKLACGFEKKGKATVASSRLLFGETGDLRRTGPPPSSSRSPRSPFFALKPRTRTHITLPVGGISR